MSWIQSFSLLVRSSVSTLREKVENPERMLSQLIVDMEEEVEHVRESIAEAIADEILMKRKLEAKRAEAAKWHQRAEKSLLAGEEKLSRSALSEKREAKSRVETLEAEYDTQKEQTADLKDSLVEIEDKIRQARQRQRLLLARLARANSQQKIDHALHRVRGDSAFGQFRRLEERVERSEAKCEAYEQLEGKDPDAEKLRRNFERREREELIDAEFDKLKSHLIAADEITPE